MITHQEAADQADALEQAAEASPLRHYQANLAAQAKEWRVAVRDLEEQNQLADENPEACRAEIELYGSLVAGMVILYHGDWAKVVGRSRTESVMVEKPDRPGVDYVNRFGPASPVVIRA